MEKENKPLYDFLKESNAVGIWEQNEKNVRSKFNGKENLKEQYPEYSDMLINKANEVKKEIFLHNHEPLINPLSKHYGCNIKTMTFADIENFFAIHKNDFKKELGNGGLILDAFIDLEEIKKNNIPTLKVFTLAKFIEYITLPKALNDLHIEQHQLSVSRT